MSVNLASGVLTITGTGAGDTYEVYQVNGSPTYIYVLENGTPRSETGWTSSAVNRIDISVLGGDDWVTIQSSTAVGRDPITETTRIYGGDGADVLSGGPYADTIYGDAGNDGVSGGGDNDILYGGYGGMDIVDGGNGNDLMYGGNPAVTNEGEPDTMTGGEGNDTLYAEGGSDIDITGGAGNDLIYGGDGDDVLEGNDGADTIYAGYGNDVLNPGAGADFAYGEDGNDTFQGSWDQATDWLDGGAGTDSAGIAGSDYDSLIDSLFNFP
jgi:Ca2+-binding RTX toxin-like protein